MLPIVEVPQLLHVSNHVHLFTLRCPFPVLFMAARACCHTQPGGVQESLKPAAALSIMVYTLGLPLSFLAILLRHRHAIFADQTLRVANEGGTEDANPQFYIRKRYQELYRCGPMLCFALLSSHFQVSPNEPFASWYATSNLKLIQGPAPF